MREVRTTDLPREVASLRAPVKLPVGRIRPAYEQVADRLRELIVSGRLKEGDRLPAVSDLATMFGVGRSTAREALRLLSSQNLVTSLRGAAGGTFVTVSDAGALRQYLEASIGLLSGNSRISADELLEARHVLEVPAARQAAERHSDDDIRRVKDAITREKDLLARGERGLRFEDGQTFHHTVLDASGNRLLQAITAPVFRVVESRMISKINSVSMWKKIDTEHAKILEAIAARDADAAGQAMATHLDHLSRVYRRV